MKRYRNLYLLLDSKHFHLFCTKKSKRGYIRVFKKRVFFKLSWPYKIGLKVSHIA